MNMILLRKQNGDGIAVIVYGVTLMLVFTFLAINLLNGKIIENGYNALRDAVQSATTGSVIHLMTSTADYEEQQTSSKLTGEKREERLNYDLYLQLALGYIINRKPIEEPVNPAESTVVQSGSVNNFIKLDHERVVNSTLALLENSTLRGKENGVTMNLMGVDRLKYFKILMIFIEPHYNNTDYEKSFDVIVYTNEKGANKGTIYQIPSSDNMTTVYNSINTTINSIVNSSTPVQGGSDAFDIGYRINVEVNDGNSTEEEMVRKLETKPYYMVVVKDFALPTLFKQTYTTLDEEKSNIFRDAFSAISGDGHLQTPIVALNSAKIERKVEGSKR